MSLEFRQMSLQGTLGEVETARRAIQATVSSGSTLERGMPARVWTDRGARIAA